MVMGKQRIKDKGGYSLYCDNPECKYHEEAPKGLYVIECSPPIRLCKECLDRFVRVK